MQSCMISKQTQHAAMTKTGYPHVDESGYIMSILQKVAAWFICRQSNILQCMPGCVIPFSESSLAKTGILSARLIRSHNVCIVNMEAVCFQYRRCNLWLYSLIPMQDSIGRDRNKVTMSECHYSVLCLLLKSAAACNKIFLYGTWISCIFPLFPPLLMSVFTSLFTKRSKWWPVLFAKL